MFDKFSVALYCITMYNLVLSFLVLYCLSCRFLYCNIPCLLLYIMVLCGVLYRIVLFLLFCFVSLSRLVLPCIVLCLILLFCIVFICCTALPCLILFCVVLCYKCCIVLCYIVPYYIVNLKYWILDFSTAATDLKSLFP